ncbi:MAG: dehypoxanthine futalosine cyclase [Rikenellaceae bacterium]|nr:dehypoxanthine futalosine cyclase [Rikenellaceae bacterium]
MNNIDNILEKALMREPLTREEAYALYDEAPLHLLADVADTLRRESVADPTVVTWQIDRNVNITNVCKSGCRFCNFHCKPHQTEQSYITTMAEYRTKIDEALRLGADQLLLQGGLHPRLGIDFYETLFKQLKKEYPQLRLNALGAPEVSHIAAISNLTTIETLQRLKAAGLDTLPGAGAEILSEDVRKRISPAKPTAREWVMVMHEAHQLGIPTTATMMYGHVEKPHQRIDHLITIRDLQAHKPEGSRGFTAFIPWVFCPKGTELEREGIAPRLSATEYIRIIAMSRIVLNNITNIQASWLTVGKEVAEIALKSGANDMGSIMIEENVVSSAGASTRFDKEAMQATIRRAGFTPQLRDQLYNYRTL